MQIVSTVRLKRLFSILHCCFCQNDTPISLYLYFAMDYTKCHRMPFLFTFTVKPCYGDRFHRTLQIVCTLSCAFGSFMCIYCMTTYLGRWMASVRGAMAPGRLDKTPKVFPRRIGKENVEKNSSTQYSNSYNCGRFVSFESFEVCFWCTQHDLLAPVTAFAKLVEKWKGTSFIDPHRKRECHST